MTRLKMFAPLLALLVLIAPGAAHAARDYANCHAFITSLPATINAPGTWCLNQDLSTAINNGYAINITSHDATLDCNDFKLEGFTAGISTQEIGVFGSDRHGVTVRHCNIRGFEYGVSLIGVSGGNNLIEDNRLDGNTYVGISVQGDGTVVRRNRVIDTGGSTVNFANGAYGIYSYNPTYAVDILDNTISGVVAVAGGNGSAYGIRTDFYSGSVNGNRVSGVVKDGTGESAGIYNNNSSRVIMRKNQVIGAGMYGLVCASANSRAKDNVINGFTTGIINCANDGNLIKP